MYVHDPFSLKRALLEGIVMKNYEKGAKLNHWFKRVLSLLKSIVTSTCPRCPHCGTGPVLVIR